MSLPFISCLCLTYCRPHHVAEAVECFHRFTYKGQKQLVLVNTNPMQTFHYDHPEVKLVNCLERPESIGEARNLAVAAADGELLTTHDDDDIYLPWHLDNFLIGFDPATHHWSWQDKMFSTEAFRIRQVKRGIFNTCAFTKHAWIKCGGYRGVNVGEDRDFIVNVTKTFHGIRQTLRNDQISFLYGWGNGVYHISGNGEDKPGEPSALVRSERNARERGILTGDVHLVPKLGNNYVSMAKEFLSGSDRATAGKKGKIGLVYLGRYGDIINVLPVAKFIAERWGKPHFFVAKQFANVLEGVSYVIPEVLELNYTNINAALKMAETKCHHVLNAQIWGENFTIHKECSSFNQESWQKIGMANHFHNMRDFPLVFDQRTPEREQAFMDTLPVGQNQPVIICSMSGGHSSPFNRADELYGKLCAAWGHQARMVDISKITAQRVFDLIGLFERANLLVTTDTATLHLAAATNIPVIALTNPNSWVSTAPRCNCVLKTDYDHWSDPEVLGTLHQKIREAISLNPKDRTPLTIAPHKRFDRLSKLVHCVELHEDKNPHDMHRKKVARESWEALYGNGVIPAHYSHYERDSRDIGDERALPYLKDIIAHGCAIASEDENPDDAIIFWSNDDTVLHPDLSDFLRMFCSIHDCCTSHRCDFKTVTLPIPQIEPHQMADLTKNEPHMGRDLIAGTYRWWCEIWPHIPDFLCGASNFDLCMAILIRRQKGFVSSHRNLYDVIAPCDLVKGMVSHQHHQTVWNTIPNSPAERHNLELFKEWALKYAPELKIPL